MAIHINEAVELGAAIIAARRRVWDLERVLNTSPYPLMVRDDLRAARREYNRLLKQRKALVAKAQQRMFE